MLLDLRHCCRYMLQTFLVFSSKWHKAMLCSEGLLAANVAVLLLCWRSAMWKLRPRSESKMIFYAHATEDCYGQNSASSDESSGSLWDLSYSKYHFKAFCPLPGPIHYWSLTLKLPYRPNFIKIGQAMSPPCQVKNCKPMYITHTYIHTYRPTEN